MKIKINNNLIVSNNSKPLLIAEISANHNGSKKKFLNHILQAKQNGADLVKIQTYEPQDMIIDKNFKIKKGLWKNKKLWKLYEEAMTPFEWHYDAFKLAKKKGIELFSTPFSVRGVKFLKQFKPKIYKIASFEITDLNLINEVAKEMRPIIISTGLASNKEIKEAINTIRKWHNKIIVLYCVSSYPAKLEEVNFNRIKELEKITKVKNIGFSDHTKGVIAPTISLTFGACMIEKHFKLSEKTKSHDLTFSVSSNELQLLRKNIDDAYLLLKTNKKITNNDSLFFRRSIYATKNIIKGEILTEDNMACYRPFLGKSANKYNNLLGKKAVKNFKRGKLI